MVDGAHGAMDHVVKHVEEEHKNVIEYVTILLLPVEEMIAQGQIVAKFHATPTAVMVRSVQHKCMVIIICNMEMKYIRTSGVYSTITKHGSSCSIGEILVYHNIVLHAQYSYCCMCDYSACMITLINAS